MKQAKKPSSTAITRLPGGRWHWTLLAVSIFLAMVVWRWQTLTWPPFDDNAVGLWSEANWLAENQFNYLRLRYEVPHMLEQPGSARSYMISVQPTLLALAIRLLPSVGAVVVAQHLLALFYTAMIVLLVYALLSDLVDRLVAALAALVVVTCPLLAAQTDLGGMDLPMAAAALGAALCVKRGRLRWAITWSAVAFLFKATAIVVGAALVIWLAVATFVERRRGGKWNSAPARNALLAIIILALQLALMKWGLRRANSLVVDQFSLLADHHLAVDQSRFVGAISRGGHCGRLVMGARARRARRQDTLSFVRQSAGLYRADAAAADCGADHGDLCAALSGPGGPAGVADADLGAAWIRRHHPLAAHGAAGGSGDQSGQQPRRALSQIAVALSFSLGAQPRVPTTGRRLARRRRAARS